MRLPPIRASMFFDTYGLLFVSNSLSMLLFVNTPVYKCSYMKFWCYYDMVDKIFYLGIFELLTSTISLLNNVGNELICSSLISIDGKK